MPRFAEHCLRRGVQAVCVTLDEQGCVAYRLDGDGELEEHVVPRIPVENVVDTTGCGDSFAAGMAFGYLFGRDIVKACQYGNAMGAQRCAGSELSIYLPRAETDAPDRAHLRPDGGSGTCVRRCRLPSGWSPRTGSTRSARTSARRCARSATATSAPAARWRRATRRPLGHLPRGRVRRPRLPRRSTWSTRRTGCRSRCSSTARGSTCATSAVLDHERTLDLRTGLLYRRTVFERRRRPPHPAGDAALRLHGRPAHLRAARGDHAGEPRRARSPSRAPSTAAGATWNGCRSTPRAPRSRWRRRGRSGRSPATSSARSARPTATSPTWRCARSTAASPSATRPRTLPSVEPLSSGFTVEDERVVWRDRRSAGGPVRLDKLVRIGTSRDVDGGADVQQGCRDGLAAARDAGFDAIVAASAARRGRSAGRTATSRSTATPRAPRPCGSASTTC